MNALTIFLLGVIGVSLTILLVLVLIDVVYQSVYKLAPGQMIVFFSFGGSIEYIVVTRDYLEHNQEYLAEIARLYPDLTEKVRGTKSIAGLDLALGLWPFRVGFRVPVGNISIPIHVSRMYTKTGDNRAPRVRITGDATWQIQLSPFLGRFAATFSVFDEGLQLENILQKGNRDLTKKICVSEDKTGNLAEVEPNSEMHFHRLHKLAVHLHNEINHPTLEAMRAAASRFTFGGIPDLDENQLPKRDGQGNLVMIERDIIDSRKQFEVQVKRVLVEDDDNIFVQGTVLKLEDSGEVKAGLACRVANLVVEDIDFQPASPDASEAERALDYPFIGLQEGRRQEAKEHLIRVGQARGLDELATTLGLEKKEAALLYDTLRERGGDINLVLLNETIQKAFERFASRF